MIHFLLSRFGNLCVFHIKCNDKIALIQWSCSGAIMTHF